MDFQKAVELIKKSACHGEVHKRRRVKISAICD